MNSHLKEFAMFLKSRRVYGSWCRMMRRHGPGAPLKQLKHSGMPPKYYVFFGIPYVARDEGHEFWQNMSVEWKQWLESTK